ncbi:MAG: glycoside hydrolase family 13 protein [Clostridia bacterium]|nr:glycoside hydrolase family 13 protein [Clostridia bacterium]
MNKVQFCPCDEKFKSPVGAIEVNKRFRIFLATTGGKEAFFVLKKEGEFEDSVYYPMVKTTDGFTYEMEITTVGLYHYHFDVIEENGKTSYFADYNLSASTTGAEWQLTVIDDLYEKPDFLRGGIFYQIMVDRFNIGGERLKSKKGMIYRDDWGATPSFRPDEKGIVHNNDMFGGNLYGVIEKLDYLKSLSVKCIYLNPIFDAASNHKYDTGNYRRVDADFGGNEALALLIKEAKLRGIEVILDGVFSHTGEDSIYFNRYGKYDSVGAYQSKKSPYYEWYDFIDYPEDYTSWWGIKLLPCVKETNPSYDEFINGEEGVVRTYMRMGIAGFRLDVADELPDEFLDNLTKAVKKVRPDAMVLGEVWEDASNKVAYGYRRRYFQGKQLDSVTNYPLKNAIISFVRDGRAEELERVVNTLVNNYPPKVLKNLMNTLSTHDTQRILTALSHDQLPQTKAERANYRITDLSLAKKRVKIAGLLQYTLPGTPCLYYGDEAGMEGCEDPFNRRCYPWGSEDKDTVEYFTALGKLRAFDEFNDGDIKIENASDGVFIFTRGDKFKVIVNASDKEYELGGKKTDIVSGKTASKIASLGAIVYQI